ncbi:WASH complex subunit 1 [Culicoides brevitarsis]|uniref:WASH complex subunit 1 n=1 Tax=Culicoides brevitarsis TaxID=469753 RepID=UPI00307B3DDC
MRLFEIPIIQPDLRHEEAILQSLNTLDYLNEVIGSVFDRIDQRIASNQAKVQDINRRIGVVNSKIESLKDSKKAVIIYSTNKYPEQEKDFTPIFGDETENQVPKPVLKKLSASDVKSSPEKVNHRKPQEKLQFYHVKEPEKAKKINKNIGPNSDLLDIIRSVDSLIVFKKDDKLSKSKTSSASSMPMEGKKLEAAPASITNKNQKKNLESIFYTPSAVDNAPQLDLPMDLPDLPGIADDITFSMDDDFMIVPSRGRSDTIASLGLTVTDSPKVTTVPQVDSLPPQVPSDQSNENLETKTEIPKPPPAPIPQTRTEEYIIPPPPPPPSDIPKPPPPPMASKTPAEIPVASNARLNLLADIRKAGGKAKLRPAAASDRKPPSEKKKEKPEPTADLMSDLRNRLQMRRKGISGAKENPQPTDMMSKLSSLIPPPSMEQKFNKNNESDDDWN